MNLGKMALRFVEEQLRITKTSALESIFTLSYVLIGSFIIFPIVSKLPLLGWDWYYFYYANNPTFNIFSTISAYPPFTKHIIQSITWMDWRTSFGLLNSITIMTVSIATWKNGGKYIAIILALTTPPLWFLMWVGHPDGLVLLGLITGIVPLILMKPILSIFGILSNRKLFTWSMLFILLSLIIWPGWVFSFGNASFGHEADIGWLKMGWPILVLGIVLLLGAGKDPYRLMAAGCFISPFLMPYHLIMIIPMIGKTQGWRQVLIWASSWFVFLGLGLGSSGQIISYIFPLTAYCFTGSFSTYMMNIRENFNQLNTIRKWSIPGLNYSK